MIHQRGDTMMRSLLVLSAVALGCDAGGDRVTFGPTGNADAGGGADVTSDSLFPNLDASRDAIPTRETSMVIPEDAACATATADAMQRPMNLLIVLDRSGSMNNTPANPTRWVSAVNALRTLLTRLDDQTRVGITFFPAAAQPDTANGYATPAVPVAPLATTRATILSRLSSTTPNGNTPMTCAIQGSTAYYRGFTMDGSRNVILITDGVPTEECTTTTADCGPLPLDFAALIQWTMCRDRIGTNAVRVAVGLAQRETPPIRVFVAGTPEASDTFLSDLAVIGQTPRTADCRGSMSCHYSLRAGSFEADLTRALDEIRGRAISCEFEVNADPSRVDPTRVNVNYQGAADAMSRLIVRDVDHRDGWDYANGMRTIVLYGPACDRVRTDSGARVRIVFGCPTATPG
jgi:hypothetical protein